jgi:hypothetical protein
VDDGMGGCLAGSVTPPTGTECLNIVAQGGYGGSAQTCFQVLGSVPPPLPPPPANQVCGTVSALNGHVTSIGAQGEEDCFYHAYLNCSPYSINFNSAQIDSGTKYSFQVQSNGGICAIVETVQNYTLPISGAPPVLGNCAGVTETQFGLLFLSCQGGGNVLVPNS